MSNEFNEALLEQLFEEALEMGMTDDAAAKFARKRFEEMPEPDYKAKGGVIKMKKGGKAFPDLTGDGKVTKKDILRGRGVSGFKYGGVASNVSRGGGAALRGTKFTGVK
jgi:hypothetical protein